MERLSPLPQKPGIELKACPAEPLQCTFCFPEVKIPNSNQATYFAKSLLFFWVTERLSHIPKLKICILLKYTIEALLVTENKIHFNLTTFNYIFKDSKLRISIFSGQMFYSNRNKNMKG